jgi:hypothetical protein
MDAGVLVESQELSIQICSPALFNNQWWQGRTPGAYGTNAFQIDWEGKTKAKTQLRVLAIRNKAEFEALNQARQSKEWKAL